MDLERVDVYDMLTKLGMRNIHKATEREWCFSCPFPGHSRGDEKPSCYMNHHTSAWFCHGCKRKGNAVGFVSELENVTPMMAARFLREQYASDFREPDGGLVAELDDIWTPREQRQLTPLKLSERLIDHFAVHWDLAYERWREADVPSMGYMFERGFAVDTLNEFEIGYDRITSRITIPVRAPSGDLIGFKARAWWPDPPVKYLVLGDAENGQEIYGFPRLAVSQAVFGISRIPQEGQVRLILCEGELNAMMLTQYGYSAVSLAGGSHVSEQQAQLLRWHADEIVIWFDDDKAGHEGAAEAIELLEPHMSVRVVGAHEGDPASMTEDEVLNTLKTIQASFELYLGH